MHFSTVFTLALPAIALATAIPHDGGNCNTGSMQCCNEVQNASKVNPALFSGLVGVDVDSITGPIGLNCDPISVIGIGGNSCAQQPVCCTGNNFNGLVVVGCTPINLNL